MSESPRHPDVPPLAAPSRPSWQYLSAIVFVIVLLVGGMVLADWWIAYPEDAVPQYVGRGKCIECHKTQGDAFVGSNHERAMDHATPKSVRGDFNNVEFTHQGITSRMFMKDGKYFMNTEGPDGRLADFEIKYTFGWEPLQQYMVEFDREANQPAHEVARLQVLRVSWDTVKKEWIYVPAPDVSDRLLPGDELHWTGGAQRWNHMCADCHSTGLEKKFNVETAKYHTTFHEINVSCEACHGPGSMHVELAESKSLFWDRNHGYGLAKLKGTDPTAEIETCAKCHSRRSNVVATNHRPGQPYHDAYTQELINDSSYFPDGQIRDEVFEHGSFIQSKMFHKGIRCTDCHDPHTTKLKHEGNKLCTSCHQHPAGKYDTANHHHHKAESRGGQCVECHMPHRTYMEVDHRRDHSLRSPRPDISLLTGSPNACTGCHLDVSKLPPVKGMRDYAACLTAASIGNKEVSAELRRLDTWADGKVKEWYPNPVNRSPSFAKELFAAWQEEPNADVAVRKIAANTLYPAQVRASAVMALLPYMGRQNLNAASKLLDDPDPSVRVAAIGIVGPVIESTCSGIDELEEMPNQRGETDRAMASMHTNLSRMIDLLFPLLSDPRRSVRVAAARALSPAARRWLGKRERPAWDLAIEEHKKATLTNNDLAGAHRELGVLAERMGRDQEALDHYKMALRIEPQSTGARSNMSLLLDRMAKRLEAQGRPADAKQLREEVKNYREEELILLARELRELPETAPAWGHAGLQYRYAMTLVMSGKLAEAEAPLLEACRRRPRSSDYLFALVGLYEKLGRWPQAIDAASQRAALDPGNREYAGLVAEMESRARAAGANSAAPK